MRRESLASAVANSDSANSIRSLHAWISKYLSEKPLSDMRKIAEWQAWATHKLASGWEPEAIKQRISDAWHEHAKAIGIDQEPAIVPGSPLNLALVDVFKSAGSGATPAQCAVVYRSLAKEHPEHTWLARYAAIWADMGDRWRELGPYLSNGW